MANLICVQWGVDASDYVNSVKASIADHPFKFVIDTYGLRHSADMATLKHTLSEPVSVSMESTLRQLPIYWLDVQIQADGPESARNTWGWICTNSDYDSFDVEGLMNLSQDQENSKWGTEELNHLRQISPESPILIASDIRNHWDAAKARQWENDHGDYPSVALALGRKYADLKRWSDSERCLRHFIAISPDRQGYEDLAKVYQSQQMEDRWLATLNEFLAHGQAYGLEDAQVQVEIAYHYMYGHDYKSALPYADAAAETESSWGLSCAAEAHSGIGDWTTAEQLIVEEMNHYSQSPYNWYSWCNHTGHGDIAGAKKALLDYFANKGENLGSEELMQLGCLQMSQQKYREALLTFQRRLELSPGPTSALHVAVIDDELHKVAERDAVLDRIRGMHESDTSLGRFATVLRNAGKAGPNVAPDAAAIEAILKYSGESDRIMICALTGQYLDDRGQTAEATGYLKRCVAIKGYSVDRLLIDSRLRQRGLDPWALEQAPPAPGAWQ